MTDRQPNDTRISFRVTALDLANWRFFAELLGTPLSALIRRAANEYLCVPTPPSVLTELPFSILASFIPDSSDSSITIDRAGLRKMTLCSKTIVLRMNRVEWHQWKLTAQQENRSASAMIRRAVLHHLRPYSEIFSPISIHQRK